jgi:CRP-like cAMP-binding protein
MSETLWTLAELTEEDRRILARHTEVIDLPEGAVLVEQGTRPEALFLLLEGRVAVETSVDDGTRRELARLEPGALVGEMSFVSDDPACATARALTPCRLGRLTADAVDYSPDISPALEARLYHGIARIIAARLRTTSARGQAATDPAPPPAWTDSLASLKSVRLPPVVESYIARYEKIGRCGRFPWRWYWRGLEETTLPTVPEIWRPHLLSVKLIALVLTVLLDDLAGRPDQARSFEEALAGLLSPVARAPRDLPGAAPAETTAGLALVFELGQALESGARVLPGWEKYRALWHFDCQQVCAALRYRALARNLPGLGNSAETGLYVPHSLNMMVFATLDLMASDLPDAELGLIRQVVWHAQNIGQTGHAAAAWRREAQDRDFSSRVYGLALERGVLTHEELQALEPDRLIECIEAAGIEELLLAELHEHRTRLHETLSCVRSVVLARFAGGVDQLLAMSLAAKGLI